MDIFGRYQRSTDVYDNIREITENSPVIEQPKNIKIELLKYQLASIWTMNEIEKYKHINVDEDYYSCAGILSNSLGSGKTATIIGLITYSKMPTCGPYYPLSIDFYPDKSKTNGMAMPIVLKSYNKVLRPALIFVGYGVLHQWAGEIIKFNPQLKYFMIDDIRALRKFYNLIYTKEINSYDIILVKNKTISGSWEWEHGEVEESIIDSGTKSIYNVIGVMCRNVCFSRVIVDDFDTIGLPRCAANLNALFFWFISSTKKRILNASNENEQYSIYDVCHRNNLRYSQLANNQVLYNLFNVCVAPEYYSAVSTVGKPQYFLYKFKNTAAKLITLVKYMPHDKVNDIMEALNGDAIEDAAKIAGIEANDPSEIFKALLQKNYTLLADANKMLDNFENYFDKIDLSKLPHFTENPDQNDTYTRKDMRNMRPINWRYPNLKSSLVEEKQKWLDVKKQCENCLNKFRDSIKNNECQVCNLELDDTDENYAILPCCHEIIHADCAVKGCNFNKVKTLDGSTIVGNCPFNKNHIVYIDKLCFIKNSVDLKNITFDYKNVEHKEEHNPTNRSKYEALLDIVNGIVPDEQTKCSIDIKELMKSKMDLPPPVYESKITDARKILSIYGKKTTNYTLGWIAPEWKPKVIIFANFDETLNKVEDEFKKNAINYGRLGGDVNNFRDIIYKFTVGLIDNLLIKSSIHCASLNLQCATDLVFAHHIIDYNIRAQVCGRIQRTGRKSNAKIHFILYENEAEQFQSP